MAKKKLPPLPATIIASPHSKRNYFDLIFLGLAVAIVCVIRYRLISIPFERDEGEYGYIGTLLLHGIAPFKYAYSMKLPGTAFMYALFMLAFGHTSNGVHTGLIVMNAATMCLLYVAFKKLFNSFIGLATAVVYGFMSVGLSFYGFAAHATHFICFYVALAVMFFAGYTKSNKTLYLLLYGVMLGMAFIMKQQAVFMVTSGGLILIAALFYSEKKSFTTNIKRLVAFSAAIFIPYLIVLFIAIDAGQFKTFWLWTVEYASTYESGSNAPFLYLKTTFVPAFRDYYYFWLLSVLGLVLLFAGSYSRFQKIFVVVFLIGSLATLSSGLYFREHYYIAALPALGLLTAIAIDSVSKYINEKLKGLKWVSVQRIILVVMVALAIYVNKDYFFNYSVADICTMAYGSNPFIPAVDIANYIDDNSCDTDKVAVLGSEPEIYFYTKCKAATGYLYTYPLMELQPYNIVMQNDMINEIEKNKPRYIIYCGMAASWLRNLNSPKKILDWSDVYTHQHYLPVGVADYYDDGSWTILFGNNMKFRYRQSNEYMILLQRKAD